MVLWCGLNPATRYLVLGSLRRDLGAAQDQLLSVLSLESPGCLLPVLGSRAPGNGFALNRGWLTLELGLDCLAKG